MRSKLVENENEAWTNDPLYPPSIEAFVLSASWYDLVPL